MKALTVRQPWAGLIALGAKDVENRSWKPTRLAEGERFAIHAGLVTDRHRLNLPANRLCELHGVILANVELVEVVRDSPSQWAEPGQFHWVLANPELVTPPVPARGRLQLWQLDDDALSAVIP